MLYLNFIKKQQHKRQENFTHGKFSKYMNVNVETRKKVRKSVQPHPFSCQKICISLANIYVQICFAAEFV